MIYDEQGQLVESGRADRLSSAVWDIVEDALRHSEESGHDIPETLSLHDQVARRAADVFPDCRDDQRLLVQMAQMWGAYIGDPPSKQSLRFAWLEKCCVGGMVASVCMVLTAGACVGAHVRVVRRRSDSHRHVRGHIEAGRQGASGIRQRSVQHTGSRRRSSRGR